MEKVYVKVPVGSAGAVLLSVLVGLAGPAKGDPTAPSSRDHTIALSVAVLLEKDHLLRRPLDDEISRRSLKTFLKMIDPMKSYFLQSDIDEFNAHQDELDDLARVDSRV